MSFSSHRFVTERFSSKFTKLRFACVTREFRSARNSTFFTQLCRSKISTSAMTVRVFPDPVAITSSARRRFFRSKLSHTARTAPFW